jgi:hypothetical protein
MTKAKARILARCIYRGSKTIEDVDEQYRADVKEQYLLLFGEELA